MCRSVSYKYWWLWAVLLLVLNACGGAPRQPEQAAVQPGPTAVLQEEQLPVDLPDAAGQESTGAMSADWAGCGIDTHLHIDESSPDTARTAELFVEAAGNIVPMMDEIGIQKAIIMPPPFAADMQAAYDYTVLAAVVEAYPERFAFLGGGGTLNPMINQAVREREVSPELEAQFRQEAENILAAGAAGFGEMAALHFSFAEGHPFLMAPPNHPLFLLLTEIAAENDVPIDLHMEAVPEDIPLPERFSSPPNAKKIPANIAAFERLLDHNPEAKIIWAHAGWDNTGYRTTDLMGELLEKHPNLYMNIKISPYDSLADNTPLEGDALRPEWQALFEKYPERFFIGSDHFFAAQGQGSPGPPSVRPTWKLAAALPEGLLMPVVCQNPLDVYRLE